jgi:hypothetical protein
MKCRQFLSAAASGLAAGAIAKPHAAHTSTKECR